MQARDSQSCGLTTRNLNASVRPVNACAFYMTSAAHNKRSCRDAAQCQNEGKGEDDRPELLDAVGADIV